MADLDSPASYRLLDPSHMEQRLSSLHQQCRQGWERGKDTQLPPSYRDIDEVVVLGMGGSAIAGDYLADLASLEKSPPIVVQREYNPPSFTDSRTLVIASSYSGTTEETLSAFQQALERGAKVLSITAGGELACLSQENRIPLLTIDYKGEPRIAVGFVFFALLGVFQGVGIISPKETEVEKAIASLEHQVSLLKVAIPSASNEAKRLALFLHNKIPVVYGAEILAGVARAWKTGLNENSKVWAFSERLPELNHNAVVGYSLPKQARKGLALIFLRSSLLHARTQLRYRITQDLLSQEGIPWRDVAPLGEGALIHMMSLHLLGLYVNYYLAILNGVDPSPVKVIDTLKSRLASGE